MKSDDGMVYLTARQVRDLLNTLTEEELDLPAFTSDCEEVYPKVTNLFFVETGERVKVGVRISSDGYPGTCIGGTDWNEVHRLREETRKRLADAEDAKTKAYFNSEFKKMNDSGS